jgi:hypothetical protein
MVKKQDEIPTVILTDEQIRRAIKTLKKADREYWKKVKL